MLIKIFTLFQNQIVIFVNPQLLLEQNYFNQTHLFLVTV